MSEKENIRLAQDAYAAFLRGDIDFILNALADDVVWEIPGPADVPGAGVRHGRREVGEFFATLAQTEEAQQFEPRRFFADDDMVVAIGYYRWRIKPTGRVVESEWAHAFTFRDGKVTKFHEYNDSEKFAEAFRATAPAHI
ncbi:MAG: nuclear transport factor 2 family protein [Vulcanimicrobiaceae bacterium]